MMVRRFKLKLFTTSFQFCRPNIPSLMVKSPKPCTSTYVFSPVNSKTFDIPYPGLPVPPPTTPTQYPFSSDYLESAVHRLKNLPVSDVSDDNMRPIACLKGKKNRRGQRTNNAKHRLSRSISSGESGWVGSEETESLFSSSPSLESSFDLDYLNGTTTRNKKNNLKVRRLKHYLSNSFKDAEKAATPENESVMVKESVLERLMPCVAEGAVTESFAVLKKSEDPYEDFKISMLEMISEKQIFAVKDLEQLLLCFLSLNSQHHHAVIVEAFTEIWEELFVQSPMPPIERAYMYESKKNNIISTKK